MSNTFQFQTLNVLDHGKSVNKHYNAIIDDLDTDSKSYELPEQLRENWTKIKSLLLPKEIMDTYQVYHDCGKPLCRVVDATGRQHFPNHTIFSAYVFRSVFKDDPNKDIIYDLISSDMTYHSGKMTDIESFIDENDLGFVFSLYMTSLAEIYANKEMFDEHSQTSFKIKYKKLTQVIKKLVTKL